METVKNIIPPLLLCIITSAFALILVEKYIQSRSQKPTGFSASAPKHSSGVYKLGSLPPIFGTKEEKEKYLRSLPTPNLDNTANGYDAFKNEENLIGTMSLETQYGTDNLALGTAAVEQNLEVISVTDKKR